MDFHPDADRRALIAEAFSRPLDALLPLARLHRADAEEPWDALAELGIFGLAADTEAGGVGLGAAEEALLALELGRRLAGPQLLATLMALHCADEPTQRLIVTGNVRVSPAVLTGETASVIGGGASDWWLLRQDGAAVLIPADRPAAATVTDDHHWTTTLTSVPLMVNSLAWVSHNSIRRVRLIEAAALCGLAACASEMAVAYAGIREQFGHPIGGFQAIKHHCANMAMAAMAARDAMTFAAMAVEQDRADAAFQVEAALLLAIDAALANGRRNVQIHGGIGFSKEADPHLVVKRAHLLIEACGGADAATERVARADAPMRREG